MNLRKEIGNRIFLKRKGLKLTQAQVAARTGCMTGAFISACEKGDSHFSIDTLIPIAKALECSIDWLLMGADMDKTQDNLMLTREEIEILVGLRRASKAKRKIILEMLGKVSQENDRKRRRKAKENQND